jgi:excisionase family DNA binding protein
VLCFPKVRKDREMSKNNIEVSVKEAADMIGVSTRSIINYIKAKEIAAIKVGKSWFIKEPSLIAFAQRHGLSNNQDIDETQAVLQEEAAPVTTTKTKDTVFSKNKKAKYIIKNLKLYELAHKAFHMKKWTELNNDQAQTQLLLKLYDLKLAALELIGAGYHSFDKKEKRNLYNQSREKVGGILALLYFDEKLEKAWATEIKFMENQLLAAYSSLIRKMEKRNEKQ